MGLGWKLAKRGVQLGAGVELVKLSKRMKESRLRQGPGSVKQDNIVEETPPVEEEFEYVFNDEAIRFIEENFSALVEVILINGVEVDEKVMAMAKYHIEMMDYLLSKTGKR